MTFRNVLLASCALVISATAATAQIPSYVPTDGLVGWWPFNGNANDESGNGNDGVVNGATLTEDRFGVLNSAYDFQVIHSVIDLPEIGSFLGAQGQSASYIMWFKGTALQNSNAPGVILSAASNPFDYQIRFEVFGDLNRGIKVYYRCPAENDEPGIFYDYDLNQWHQIVAVVDGEMGRYEYFFDGVLISSMIFDFNASNNYFNASRLWKIGTINPWPSAPSHQFYGQIDDIAIYNRALTLQEIQNLYNGTTETVDTGDGAAPLPQGIPYQAAARDAQGQVIADAPVNVRFTLHEGAADGAASYAETHALTTNSVGLFNTVFGNGTPEQSAFDSINWAATTKFLQVEIDLGEGYVDMGTTQLLSVPYALRSDESARVKNAGLPIFSNNAAAIAGGLVAGEMYRTAAGVLMVAY